MREAEVADEEVGRHGWEQGILAGMGACLWLCASRGQGLSQRATLR